MERFYNIEAETVAKKIGTHLQKGLSKEEAQSRLKSFGPNTLKNPKTKSVFIIFLSQFSNLLVLILLAVSIFSFIFGEYLDAAMIIAIVFLNATVGFIQEYRAEKSIQQLKKLITSQAFVFRNGQLLQIPSEELVPGDVIQLEEGQKVPADIRLISTINLTAIEAALTGESTPVEKTARHIPKEDIPIADQVNMVFSGTIIASGKGMGVVISTGMNTEIGKIADLVSKEEKSLTPLQKKLEDLGKFIGTIIIFIAVMIGIEQILISQEPLLKATLSAIALAVAAIPEGLPAIVTISLALGTKRLLGKQALIRSLPAAETLGSTDVICVDKTGTLTEGTMHVRQIYYNDQIFTFDHQKIVNPSVKQALEKIFRITLLSSNARMNGETVIGEPTETALFKTAAKHSYDHIEMIKRYTRVQEVPFSSNRKMMSVITEHQGTRLVAAKGATEVILGRCSKIDRNGKITELTEKERDEIIAAHDEMAENALRVIAFAYKTLTKNDSKAESDLVFLGLQGMIDPPREGVKEAIATCQKQAGIKVVMITGDHLITACAIASEIGITGKAISGIELDSMTDEDLKKAAEEIAVYARVNPEHKVRIVEALKARGHQVAMTGDGVNDAPALKGADIGISMGISGTDVAKESADMILLDDHFNTIVTAVKEGRGIYDNIRKFVLALLASNAIEVIVIFFAIILGWPLPLLPIHLLWINLVTDGLPAVALGIDPLRKDIMNYSPQHFKEDIINKSSLGLLGSLSFTAAMAVLFIFAMTKNVPVHAQTMAFTAVALYELVIIFAIRSRYKLSLISNPFLVLAAGLSLVLHLFILYSPISISGVSLQMLFKVQPLQLGDWMILLGIGAMLFLGMRLLSTKIFTVKQYHKEKLNYSGN